MVKAWYMQPHERECASDSGGCEHENPCVNPPEIIDLDTLRKVSGVLCWKLDAESLDGNDLEEIKRSRGYTYQDTVEIAKNNNPGNDEKLKGFATEHLHKDEEIRFVIKGSGYFDVRDKNDKWIRLLVNKGDLLILPCGIYHRLILDKGEYIKLGRLFKQEPVWEALNRPSDDHPARKEYLKNLEEGFRQAVCIDK